MAIPASNIVSVNPRALSAGGTDLEINGLLLTKNSMIPLASTVMEFTSASAVGEYLGTDTPEYIAASKYFSGYENCYAYPRRLMIARRIDEAVGAEIKGAKYSGKLGDLAAITNGALEINYNGKVYKFSGIDLSETATYSDVAQDLQAIISAEIEGVTVSYSSLTGGYFINFPYIEDTDNSAEAVEYETDTDEGEPDDGNPDDGGDNPDGDNPEPDNPDGGEPEPEPETKYGTLTISKEIDGESEATEFGFTVQIGDETYEITIDNDEYKSFDGIVAGTEFTVTETDSKGASSVAYTVDEEEPVEGTSVSGVIEADSDTDVTFINTYVEEEPEPEPEPETKYGTLTISKEIDGETDASAFGFTVVIGEETYELTLDKDGSKTYENIPVGTEYAVTETDSKDANSVAYSIDDSEVVEGTSVTGVIEEETDTGIKFINTFVEEENPDDGGDNPDDGEGGDGDGDDDGNTEPEEGEPISLNIKPLATDEEISDLAVILNLLADAGAINSDGSDALTIADNFKKIREKTDNWATFTTAYVATDEEMMEYTQWAMSQGVQYLYCCWSPAASLTTQGETVSIASQFETNNVSSVILSFKDLDTAVFVMSCFASVDWNRRNGVITLAFKSQDGLAPTVTNETEADVLLSKKCNFYGQYATRNNEHVFFYDGRMFGDYGFADAYVNAIWFNNALQNALLEGLKMSPRTPYTDAGYTMIRAWMMDPILRAVNNGVIDAGVVLSSTQKQEVYQETGMDISGELYANGYVIVIEDAGASVRVNRESPNISLYYCYGGSVHKLTVASTALL